MNSKQLSLLAALSALSLFATQQAFGFAAGSDSFAGAPAINVESEVSNETNLSFFFAESGEPGHQPDGNPGALKSAWWSWTAPQTGFCTVDTLETSRSDNALKFSMVAVYTGNAVNALTRVEICDSTPLKSTNHSSVTFRAEQGAVYRIAVDTYEAGEVTPTRCNVKLQVRLLALKAATRDAILTNSRNVDELGIVTMTTSANGSLSGKMTLGKKVYSFAGVFGVDGYYHAAFVRTVPAKAPPQFPITLLIDGTGPGRVTVSMGDHTASNYLGERPVFSLLTPNPVAGRFTGTMSVFEDVGGIGSFSAVISASGVVTGTGFMMDGTPITFSSNLHRSLSTDTFLVPAYMPLAAGKGAFALSAVITDRQAGDRIHGGGSYVRPAPTVAGTLFYPLGIAFNVGITGGIYTPPAKGERALGFLTPTLGAGKLNVINSGGEIAGSFSEALTFSTLNKFSFISLVRKPTLTLNATTGMITGTITEPAGKVRKIQAALCNSAGQSYLAGYVTGTKRNIACTVTVP
jgi:hypothetical protein